MDQSSSARDESQWKAYYEVQSGRSPRRFFLEVLARFEAELAPSTARKAIDLGCGDGTETAVLLNAGWQVLAIDQQAAAIAQVQSRVPLEQQARLQTQLISFEAAVLPIADLVYAGFSLPFCSPQQFHSVWHNIVTSVRPGGRFAGQLFGDRDDWAIRDDMTFHTIDAARNLFEAFEVESFKEIDEDGPTALSGLKHWHIYEVMARKLP